MIDVEPTAETIDRAAKVLEDAARELRNHAKAMREDKDITRVSEAMGTIQNIWPNIRLDLFVTRPLRALGAK